MFGVTPELRREDRVRVRGASGGVPPARRHAGARNAVTSTRQSRRSARRKRRRRVTRARFGAAWSSRDFLVTDVLARAFLMGAPREAAEETLARAGLRRCVFAVAWQMTWHVHGLGTCAGDPRRAAADSEDESEESEAEATEVLGPKKNTVGASLSQKRASEHASAARADAFRLLRRVAFGGLFITAHPAMPLYVGVEAMRRDRAYRFLWGRTISRSCTSRYPNCASRLIGVPAGVRRSTTTTTTRRETRDGVHGSGDTPRVGARFVPNESPGGDVPSRARRAPVFVRARVVSVPVAEGFRRRIHRERCCIARAVASGGGSGFRNPGNPGLDDDGRGLATVAVAETKGAGFAFETRRRRRRRSARRFSFPSRSISFRWKKSSALWCLRRRTRARTPSSVNSRCSRTSPYERARRRAYRCFLHGTHTGGGRRRVALRTVAAVAAVFVTVARRSSVKGVLAVADRWLGVASNVVRFANASWYARCCCARGENRLGDNARLRRNAR